MNLSPIIGWKKAFQAHSPSKQHLHSPVVPSEGRLCPSVKSDDRMLDVIWSLEVQEEYYYQNLIELISHCCEFECNNLLRLNRLVTFWPDRLVSWYKLGSGCFGTVYHAKNRYTEERYAVKEVTTDDNYSGSLLKKTISIMTERGAFLRCNNSPYVVKLHGAFQDTGFNSYWLVFEYCIGDLEAYLSFIKMDMLLYMNKMLKTNVMSVVYKTYKDNLNLDIESIAGIFGFELLSGLAYFSERNILHNDLKPDNVLVSERGHLKISDLGLTQRIKWLDRRSGVQLSKTYDLKGAQINDDVIPREGNYGYTDPEVLIFYELFMEKYQVYELIESPNFPIVDGEQNFLTDLFGVALIMLDLLFANMNIITSHKFPLEVKLEFDIDEESDSFELFTIKCIYDNFYHKHLVAKMINNQATDENQDLIDFLLTCFKPRPLRALDYTKEIISRRMKKTYTTRCIDIDKVQRMGYYQQRNITQYNVINFTLPSTFMKLYSNPLKEIEAEDFNQLLDLKLSQKTGKEQELRFCAFNYANQ